MLKLMEEFELGLRREKKEEEMMKIAMMMLMSSMEDVFDHRQLRIAFVNNLQFLIYPSQYPSYPTNQRDFH